MIYLDNNATTRIHPEVRQAMEPWLGEQYGNPSASYRFGRAARQALERAHQQVAELIGARPEEIVLTSGGTESDNTAIHAAVQLMPERRHLVISSVEHSAIVKPAAFWESLGYEVTRLPVDREGLLDPDLLRGAVRPDATALVSVMWANSETGVILPVAEAGEIAHAAGALFHTDAVQGVGKLPVDLSALPMIDLLSLSGHKFHGPKGIGALFVSGRIRFRPFLHGGGQEKDRRSGTENVPGAVGLGQAAVCARSDLGGGVSEQIGRMRDRFETLLLETVGGVDRNGSARQRLPNTSNLFFPGVDAEGLVLLANPRLNELYGADHTPVWVEGQPLAAINAALTEQAMVTEEIVIEAAADMRLLERRLRDGRWVLVRDRTLPGGRQLQLHTEITQLKQRELDLQHSNADLEQFAYVASHDLQEPLRMITGYLQLLERRYRNKLDDSAHEFIAIAVDGAKRMQQLILDLLAFSRISTRSQTYASTDMAQVLSSVLANLEAAIRDHAARIDYDPLPTIVADSGQMHLLLQNLLANALRFHKPDEPPHITISAQHLKKTCHAPLDGQVSGWIFAVCDNGIGIEPCFFERIFIIFQRLHTREEYPGTGIGLAVCKKIVERHGGRIWVESKLDQGTCFRFFLPDHSLTMGPA